MARVLGKKDTVREARKILKIESEAIRGLLPRIGRSFEKALDLLYQCSGRVIVTGMGKTGFIARKISATLASTGTPSLYLHPGEAFHGDLGMVIEKDLVVALSHSGETEEVVRLLSPLKKLGVKIIALTGNIRSTLGRNADVALDISISREACPLGLAPSTSTAVALAMGDALALTLSKKKGFRQEDFAFLHPGGNLGKKLLKVKDLMRKGKDHPVVREDISVKSALFAITKARAGSCSVVNKSRKLIGIFTDGDLRRQLRENGEQILLKPIYQVATKNPFVIHQDHLAAEALHILREKKVDEIPVVDRKGRPVGLLDVQDLLKAGFV
ncbi:MAG: KpsF/GutQ family sugar-phosphate isomerase [Candidatus Omnitrophica bacterium]|nr:KpsF/GutQ family sugar-phosphate isomerase [Candidatus Omnitrophota bacterium]